MTAPGFLADLLLRSSLLMALIWLAAAGLRGTGGSASMRHLIWLLGLASLALVPLLAAMMPRLELPILPGSFAAAAPAAADVPAMSVTPAIAAASSGAATALPGASLGLGDLMLVLYLAVAAGLIGRLTLGRWLLGRLWAGARPCEDPRLGGLLASFSAALGLTRRVDLRLAAGPAMPMTWGSLRPCVLLPAEAFGWSDERLRIVLLHELAHVARYDSLGRAAAATVSAFYWFNPAVWYAVRQMRREQEHACDDLVLACGTKASAYARNLLDAARSFRMPAIVAGVSVAMAAPSELERRLTAIVRRGSRRRAGARFGAACAAAALAATALVATATPVARLPGTSPPALPRIPERPVPPSVSAGNARQPQAMIRPPALPSPPPAGSQAPAPGASADAPEQVPADADYRRALARYRDEHRSYAQDVRRFDRENALYHRDLGADSHGDPGRLSPIPPIPPNRPIPPIPPLPAVPALPATSAAPTALASVPHAVTPPKQGP